MEESRELQSEENKVLPEKTKKRKLKTPAQVEALEEFYNEHKYPTESMKMEVAEKIGLTEKQVSGWFCHRRLKDKRVLQGEAYGSGKQDRSSGVIQDRGSGLRQDSCGSTKQGDCGLLDPREVESRSLYGEDLMPEDLNYEQGRHYAGDLSTTDDSSSDTSSPLQDKFIPQRENPCDMEATKWPTEYTTSMPVNANGRGNIGPSGYLKVKGDVENAAITAVKRQLGRYYRDDGPPLGVKFQPLPPGAFDTPGTDQVHDLYRSGSPFLPNSSNVPGVRKQPNLSMRYEGVRPNMTCSDSYMEGGDLDATDGSRQSKQKSSFPNCTNPSASRNHSAKRNEDPIMESSYTSSKNYRMRSKHGAERMRLDYIGKLPSKQTEPWLDNFDDGPKFALKRERFDSKPPNLVVRHNKSLDMEGREPSRRMEKEEKLYGGRKAIKECRNPIGAKLHSTSEMQRASDDFPCRDYVMKTPLVGMHPQENQMKGYAVDVPSSFSEDETAETSSSMD